MSADTTPKTVEEANKALVAEFMEVFSGGEVHDILSYLTDGATWWVAGNVDGISGTKNKTEFGEMLSGLSPAHEDGSHPADTAGLDRRGRTRHRRDGVLFRAQQRPRVQQPVPLRLRGPRRENPPDQGIPRHRAHPRGLPRPVIAPAKPRTATAE